MGGSLREFAVDHRLGSDTREWIGELDADGYAPRHGVFSQIRDHLRLAATTDELVASYRARAIELTDPTPHLVFRDASVGEFVDSAWFELVGVHLW